MTSQTTPTAAKWTAPTPVAGATGLSPAPVEKTITRWCQRLIELCSWCKLAVPVQVRKLPLDGASFQYAYK